MSGPQCILKRCRCGCCCRRGTMAFSALERTQTPTMFANTVRPTALQRSLGCAAGFTPSEAPVQKKCGDPYHMNTIPPTAFTRHAQWSSWTFCWGPVLHGTLLLALHWKWTQLTSRTGHQGTYDTMTVYTKSFPLFPNHYFNISGLLACCKKNEKCAFVGPLLDRTCWTCLNPPLLGCVAIAHRSPGDRSHRIM